MANWGATPGGVLLKEQLGEGWRRYRCDYCGWRGRKFRYTHVAVLKQAQKHYNAHRHRKAKATAMIQTNSHTSVSAAMSNAVYHMDTHAYENADSLPVHAARVWDVHNYTRIKCNQCGFGISITKHHHIDTGSAVLSVRS